MFNFTTRTSRLFCYYALDVKEVEKLDKFLQFLEKSGVSEILNSVKVNDQSKGNNQSAGGRATYNPCHLFATILYGFAFGKGTLREIEASCKFDLRYMYLMDYEQPDFKTFGNFINAYILPNYEKLF
jgi:transposase